MSKVSVISATVVPRLRLTLIALDSIAKDEIIVACSPSEIIRERTWRTIQVDHSRHVRNEFLDYVDHSCNPNAFFNTETLQLVSLRQIAAKEPITFFYPGSEVELAQDFICNCACPECLGHLKGGFYLTPKQMRWAISRGYCTNFMRQEFARLLEL